MADTSLKVGITLQKDKFKKDVQEAVKDAKSELKTLNGEEILNEEKITALVKEREKILKKSVQERIKQGYDPQVESFEMINQKQKNGSGGYEWQKFKDAVSGEYYETPAELEEKLRKKMEEQQVELERLRLAEETKKVEEDITKENDKQVEALNEANKERQGTTALDTLGKGSKELAENTSEAAGMASAVSSGMVAGMFAVEAIQIALKAVVVIVLGIVNIVMDAVNMVKSENEEIKHMMDEIKAMVESIYYTIGTLLVDAIKWILNAIVECLRFVQHVVYALTKVDILKYTADRLAKNMKSAANSASELRKQLMGFDEANVLSDNGSTSALGNKDLDIDLSIDENYFDKLKKKASNLLKDIKEKFSTMWTNIKQAGGEQWGLMFTGMEDITKGFGMKIEGAWKMMEGGAKFWTGLITGDWDLMNEGLEETFEGFHEWFEADWVIIKGFIKFILGAIKGIFYWVIDEIKKKIKQAYDWIIENVPFAKDIIDGIYAIGNAWSWVYNNIIKPIADKLIELMTKWNQWKSNLFGGNYQSKQYAPDIKFSSLSGGSSEASAWDDILKFDNGGIVLAQPGHGVPISAIMSERRSEAIIPFENPTAMEMIGEAIGRYVNIAIQNQMVVDGKVLASATNNQINKERFLMNR